LGLVVVFGVVYLVETKRLFKVWINTSILKYIIKHSYQYEIVYYHQILAKLTTKLKNCSILSIRMNSTDGIDNIGVIDNIYGIDNISVI